MNNKLYQSKVSMAVASALTLLSSVAVSAEEQAVKNESAYKLEKIVITANHREENVQESSLVIQSFGGDEIDKSGISEVASLSTLIPGLQVGKAGPSLQVYIRGVGNPGTTAVTNPAVAINKNGVYIARSQAAAASFYDLSRIEVLKGPQGTLYGRNATGGAINLLVNTPELDEKTGSFSVDLGNYDLQRVEGAINVPIGEEAALRASFYSSQRDGYMSDDTNDEDVISGRLQALWQPSDEFSVLVSGQYTKFGGKGSGYYYAGAKDAWESIVSPGGNATLMAGAAENGLVIPLLSSEFISDVYPNLPSPAQAGLAPLVDLAHGLLAVTDGFNLGPADPNAGLPPGTTLVSLVDPILDDTEQDMEFWDLSATFEWDLGFANLTVIPAYQKAEMHYTIHPGLSYETANPLDNNAPETSETSSLEVRLSKELDDVKWVAGLYTYKETQDLMVLANSGVAQNISILANFENQSLGLFGQVTYSLTDETRLVAGLRYSEDDVDKKNFERYAYEGSAACVRIPGPGAGSNLDPSQSLPVCKVSGPTNESASFDSIDWKLGVEHDVSPDNMIFFTASTGYKAGGTGVVDGGTFKPEELLSFELGSRNMFMDDRLQFNFDIFYWDYTEHQEFTIGPDDLGIVSQFIINAGDATIKGASFDLLFALTDVDLIHVGAEYLHAYYDDFTYQQSSAFTSPDISCNQIDTGNAATDAQGGMTATDLTIDCSGFQMTKAPKWSGNVSYTHSFELSSGAYIDASIDASYLGARWLSPSFLPSEYVDSHTVINTNITYTSPDDDYVVIAYVRNITEEETFGSSLAHSQVPQLVGIGTGAPRTYGIKFRYNF